MKTAKIFKISHEDLSCHQHAMLYICITICSSVGNLVVNDIPPMKKQLSHQLFGFQICLDERSKLASLKCCYKRWSLFRVGSSKRLAFQYLFLKLFHEHSCEHIISPSRLTHNVTTMSMMILNALVIYHWCSYSSFSISISKLSNWV